MKRFIFIYLFFCSVFLFATTSKAIIKIDPVIGGGDAVSHQIRICSNYSRKVDGSGLSKHAKCIKEYEFHRKIEDYFKRHFNDFKSSSGKVVLGSKTSSKKEHYELSCDLYMILDEKKEKKHRIFFTDIKQKGIYYFQLDCDLRNTVTNEKIDIYEKKRKVFVDNNILKSGELIKEGEIFLNDLFPKANDFEEGIKYDINYKYADLKYKYNHEDRKKANGKEKGKITISNIVKDMEWAFRKPQNLTEFVLKAKQGKFIENGSKSVKFIAYDYYAKNKKLEYEYQTYNCNKKGIENQKFETFTLQRVSQLSIDEDLLMKELKVPFECQEPYYTVTVTQKTTSKVKPLEQYRGISKTLESFEEDKDVYYIYVDADKAKIEQYHINKLSTRKIHKEAYELNMDSCKYEVKAKDTLVKNLGSRNIFKSEDAGWGFEDDTKIGSF